MLFKNCFRKPIFVLCPRPEYFEYTSGKPELLGYVVTVKYDNNTVQNYLFAHAEEKLCFFEVYFAYSRAMKFYERKFKQVCKQK